MPPTKIAQAGTMTGKAAYHDPEEGRILIIFVKSSILGQPAISNIPTLFIFAGYMKKFALIILLAVYGLAITGAGMAPVMLGGNLACTHADGLAESNKEADRSSCGGETCNTCSIGLTVNEHQQAARQFHFASRHLLKLAEGNPPTGLFHIQPTRLYAGYSHIQGVAVPAYILHCVYRL